MKLAELPPEARWVLRQARRQLAALPRPDWPGRQPHNYLMLFWPPERLKVLAYANAWPLPPNLERWLFRDPAQERWERRRRQRRLARDLCHLLGRDPALRDLVRDLLLNLPLNPTENPHDPAPAFEEDGGRPASPSRQSPAPAVFDPDVF